MNINNHFYLARIKDFFHILIYEHPLLRILFILMYNLQKRRPWSLGYNVYKYNHIKNTLEHNLNIFDGEKLPAQYGFGLDERVVEYPWFFSRLKKNEITILDAGSTLNHASILSLKYLKNRKLYISTLSCEGFHHLEKVPSYIYEDLKEMSYKNDFLDAVVCLSTLEHVGMDNTFLYTTKTSKKENDESSYLKALKELKRILKVGGSLYLTMPFGKYKNHKWFQVFDEAMVLKIKEEFAPSKISETYFKYENKQWNYSNARACRDATYFDIHHERRYRQDHLVASESVVCLELVK